MRSIARGIVRAACVCAVCAVENEPEGELSRNSTVRRNKALPNPPATQIIPLWLPRRPQKNSISYLIINLWHVPTVASLNSTLAASSPSLPPSPLHKMHIS